MITSVSFGDVVMLAVVATSVVFLYEQWRIWTRRTEWRRHAKHDERKIS